MGEIEKSEFFPYHEGRAVETAALLLMLSERRLGLLSLSSRMYLCDRHALAHDGVPVFGGDYLFTDMTLVPFQAYMGLKEPDQPPWRAYVSRDNSGKYYTLGFCCRHLSIRSQEVIEDVNLLAKYADNVGVEISLPELRGERDQSYVGLSDILPHLGYDYEQVQNALKHAHYTARVMESIRGTV